MCHQNRRLCASPSPPSRPFPSPSCRRIVGMCTGMDGIGGQVYGAGQYAALGVLLQRASLACSLVCLPVYALWTQAAWLMQQLGGCGQQLLDRGLVGAGAGNGQ